MSSRGSWIQRVRVPLGFVAAASFIALARPTPWSLGIGVGVALIGLAIRAWASGHIHKNDQLATSGPYAHTRNPLYLGSFILGLGFTLAANRWYLALVFTLWFVGIYLVVMRVEAATMLERFGDEFRNYAREVPVFLPRLTAYRDGKNAEIGFDSSLYLRYREYRAALGLIAAIGFLVARTFLIR